MPSTKTIEQLDRGSDYVFVLDISGSMEHDGKSGLANVPDLQPLAAWDDAERARCAR